MNNFSTNRLRSYRKTTGLNQTELAFLLDKKRRRVYDLERGVELPDLQLGLHLQSALGAQLSRLYPDIYRRAQLKVSDRAELLLRMIQEGALRGDPHAIKKLGELSSSRPAIASSKRIIGLVPTEKGLGFAVLEQTPMFLLDWGVARCGKLEGVSCLERLDLMLKSVKPSVVVLENTLTTSLRSSQTKRLIQQLSDSAQQGKVSVAPFTREEIQNAFSIYNAKTKEEIAKAVALEFPELEPRLPKPRENYRREQHNMSIFVALSLAISYIQKQERTRKAS